MAPNEIIVAQLNTSSRLKTLLIKRDSEFFVRKEFPLSSYELLTQLHQKQNRNPCPHIVNILSVTKDDSLCYMDQTWIRGKTLEELLETNANIPDEDLLHYSAQICQALSWFHLHGLIHRDVTASNVMIDETNQVILIDPGILRAKKKQQTSDTTILGTPGYAAPEQFGFTQTDERSDIYSFGVLLCKMFTGVLPNEALPKRYRLRKIIKKCTAIDANKRYATAQKVMSDLSLVVPRSLPWDIRLYRHIPGFRTAVWWKMICADIFYVFAIAILFMLWLSKY